LNCRTSGCAGSIEMPESILEEAACLYATATDEPYVAVLCDRCKHGILYSVRRLRESGSAHDMKSLAYGRLNLFCVSLECENSSCSICTIVYAPKPPTATASDVKSEFKLWTLGGIRCRCGELVRVQKSTEVQLIEFVSGLGGKLTH
jgi:hypothetical protein